MPNTGKPRPLPQWARLAILGVLTALLVFNVLTGGDSALSILIGGGLLAAVGIGQNGKGSGS